MSDTDQLHSPDAVAHAQATKARKAAADRAAGVPLTELGQDFEASTYAALPANSRAEYREAT